LKTLLCNEVIRQLDFAAQCELAASLGYDGLEVAPFTLGENPQQLGSGERARLRSAASDAGIGICGLHWLLVTPAGLSITTADTAVRKRTLDVMRGLVELCADLGGKFLVHGSPAQRELDPADPQGSRERARELFAAVADDAAAAGVRYCLEPLSREETGYLNTVAEAAALAQSIGNPALCTMLDCRAARLTEADDIPTLLERWLPTGLIGHVHLNDRNRRAPGQGSDTFGEVLAALRRLDYSGALGVEPFVYEPDGPTTAAVAAGYLRGISEAAAGRIA
jgi:sugar phosphate isomerase/epimerase